jgi:hypothetical protein
MSVSLGTLTFWPLYTKAAVIPATAPVAASIPAFPAIPPITAPNPAPPSARLPACSERISSGRAFFAATVLGACVRSHKRRSSLHCQKDQALWMGRETCHVKWRSGPFAEGCPLQPMALGIAEGGEKHVLEVWQGATENTRPRTESQAVSGGD